MKTRKWESGSLTVEAIISFTVFLMASFLMLHLVKLTMLSLTLQNAAAETAKQLATAAYPMVVVNAQQQKAEAHLQSLIDDSGATLETLLGGDSGGVVGQLLGTDAAESVNLAAAVQDFMAQGQDALIGAVSQLKGTVGLALAAQIMDGYLEASGLPFDKAKVRFRMVKLPQTDVEFNYTAAHDCTISGKKQNLTLHPASKPDATDGDFNRDDVVVCAEYDYTLALPMLPKLELTLRSVAIEHAWLTGCQVRTLREEGLRDDWIFDDKVYIATGGYGKCFHRKDCRSLKPEVTSYRTGEINRSVAVAQNWKPCKNCNP